MTPVTHITAVNRRICARTEPADMPETPAVRVNRPLLDKLRRQIARIENREPRFSIEDTTPTHLGEQQAAPWRFDLTDVDDRLPGHGLSPAAVHEIAGSAYGEMPAAMGFATALTTRLIAARTHDTRPVLWCRHSRDRQEYGSLCVAGLTALGLEHDHLITASFGKARTLLWTLEEALKSRSVAAIITDMDADACDLTATRRLALAAAAADIPVLLLAARPSHQASSAQTRWHISAARSPHCAFDQAAPGAPAWTATLSRCRAGASGTWSMVWHHETHSFSLASPVSDRTVHRRPQAHGFAAAV